VRTGADAFEAFCLGAKAVLVGRPYVYGLALAGKEGVRDVIGDLAADIDLTLGLAGHRCLTDASRVGRVARRALSCVGSPDAGEGGDRGVPGRLGLPRHQHGQ
jgi:isopentenyl diphosphate isomerase/L-lactate dehydrogenase-like FMN-dependent dehydrogenase